MTVTDSEFATLQPVNFFFPRVVIKYFLLNFTFKKLIAGSDAWLI